MACQLCAAPDSVIICGNCSHSCNHRACRDCLLAWIAEHLPRCREEWYLRIPCFDQRCSAILPQALALEVSNEARRLVRSFEPLLTDLNSQLAITALKRKAGHCAVWGPRPSSLGVVCASCGLPHLALLANPACGHAACFDCWARSFQDQLPRCRTVRLFHPQCFTRGCQCAVASDITLQSDVLSVYAKEVDSEAARLGVAGESLVWGPEPSQPGPLCPVCSTHKLALLSNPVCSHTACEDCWGRCVETQVPNCRVEQKLRPRCFGSCCDCSILPVILRLASKRSSALLTFVQESDSEVARLTRPGSAEFRLALMPEQPGPICPICQEHKIGVLDNIECGHTACEDCWAQWAAEQAPRCRAEMCAQISRGAGSSDFISLRCVGAACRTLVPQAVWSHACTRSDTVSRLEAELALRRRLSSNVLFPLPVQVECPLPGCLGLGYLGYDTVMCFACEHQWQADQGEAPHTDVGGEMVGGELVKKCPSCGEHIVKNGGCDHMTCRCRYQFWWTTLKPYIQGLQ